MEQAAKKQLNKVAVHFWGCASSGISQQTCLKLDLAEKPVRSAAVDASPNESKTRELINRRIRRQKNTRPVITTGKSKEWLCTHR